MEQAIILRVKWGIAPGQVFLAASLALTCLPLLTAVRLKK